jgi:serpin B
VDLIPPLQSLGVSRIFERYPPAVDIVEQEPLFISGAFHQAVLRVDEKGVEGAAATALVVRGVSAQLLPEVEMKVDRPFFFLVTHRDTGCVLFIARVVDP